MIIYKITNLVNGKSYIGKTTQSLERRWNGHKKSARSGSMVKLACAIRKHGADNFVVEVIERMTTDVGLDVAEQLWIKHLKTKDCGYNMTDGGEGRRGGVPWNKGRTLSAETREKIRARLYGRPSGRKGSKASAELKAKLSAAHQGVKLSEAHRLAIANGQLGKARPRKATHAS